MTTASILIVDDDPGLRALVATSLTLEGHQVATAADGASALIAVEEVQPALILLDKAMPRLDGPEFARELRTRGFDIPIVVISGSEDGQRFARDIEARSFIRKPFNVPHLLDVVAGLLAGPADEEFDEARRLA